LNPTGDSQLFKKIAHTRKQGHALRFGGGSVLDLFALTYFSHHNVVGIWIEKRANDLGVTAAECGDKIRASEGLSEFGGNGHPRREMLFRSVDQGAIDIPNRGSISHPS
jgi:hypothetical protein